MTAFEFPGPERVARLHTTVSTPVVATVVSRAYFLEVAARNEFFPFLPRYAPLYYLTEMLFRPGRVKTLQGQTVVAGNGQQPFVGTKTERRALRGAYRRYESMGAYIPDSDFLNWSVGTGDRCGEKLAIVAKYGWSLATDGSN
jgi:hypothetical protein